MTTNELTPPTETTADDGSTGDSLQDNDSDICDILGVDDTGSNVIPMEVPQVDVCECLTKLAEDLKASETFNAKRAVVVVLDNNDQIGIFGYGSIHNAHQTLGILEQAKFAILAPQPKPE